MPGGRQEAAGEGNSRAHTIYILGLHLVKELDFGVSFLWATEVKRTLAEESQKGSMEESSQSPNHSS